MNQNISAQSQNPDPSTSASKSLMTMDQYIQNNLENNKHVNKQKKYLTIYENISDRIDKL